ncbi:hypothetical protein ACKI14_45115 [Streptomyces turgidiscabies]|uniref:hypothetical protein n=1 Tax=Streptomyces turgidiscabies TaxID=85558 RepID=UPI0038F66FD3
MSEQQTEQTAEATVEEAPQCAFPDCTARPVPKDPTKPGRAPKYCSDPEHNAMTAYKAKHGKPGTRKATVEEPSDRVVTDASRTAGIVQDIVLQKVDELQVELARYVEALQVINDPDAVEAEVASVAAAADNAVAEWRKKATTANTERDTALSQRNRALAETEEAQEAADRAITELEEETTRFERETEEIREKAKAEVAAAQDEIRKARAAAVEEIRKVREETEQAIQKAQGEADQKAAGAKAEADKRVEEAQKAAGKAQLEAKAEVEAMQKTAKAAQDAANAAKERAREADVRALQAERDAETRVAAEKDRRTEQEKAHAAELGRAIERQGVLEGQVEKLNGTVNDTKDKMREVQTELALAQAEAKRLTTAGGK